MSDGSIKISTILDSAQAKKGLQEIEKAADNTGKKIAKSMNDAEKSMQKAFDGSKIAKQLKTVDSAIDKTNQNIDKQRQKLDKLQESYKKASTPKEKDSISKEMDKATTSIGKLETKLNGLKDKQINLKVKMDGINGLDREFKSAEMSATKSVDNIKKKVEEAEKSFKNLSIGESISKTGKLISNVGDSFTRNVTAPVTLLGVAAAKVGMDFDAQMSRVKAISGATGEEFKQLHDQALQLGKDTAFSAKQAAEGMENLAAAGFNTQETMAAMPGLLDLAAASGESLATSSDIAASTLRGFGLEANQAGHVADVLAKNASATNAAVADTGEAMKYIAPVAHSMGLGLEEVTAAIGEMANQGIKGSQAGTTLRSALTRLASPSDEAAGAMKEIGFNAYDSQDKLKSLSEIIDEYGKALEGKTDKQKQDLTATIFGQEAMSGMLVLMQGGKKGLDDLTNSYKASDGAAKDMATTMQDNAKSAIEQMTGSLETAGIKVEEAFAPAITDIANKIQELANNFSDLTPEQQKFYGELLIGAAAAGPLLKLIGGLTSGIGGFVGLLGKFAPSAAGATVAMEEIAGAGTVGAGGVAALGTSLGTALAAIAPFVIGAAAIGTAGYGVYDAITKEVVPSVDLFADKVKYASETVQTEHGTMQKVVATEMTKISDSTKKAVQGYLDMDNNAKSYLQDLYINNSTITSQIVSDAKTKFDAMANATISGYEKQKNDSISKLTDLFSQQKDITAQEQADILEKTSKYYSDKESKTEEDEARINEIVKNASSEKRGLTAEEVSEIATLQNDMRDNAINALSAQETEAAVILQRMKDYDGQITAEQVSEKIKALNDSRDQAIQAANDEYDQKIAVITDMRDNVGSITAEEADTMIENAKKQRDETVAEAEKTRDGAVGKILEMNESISGSVDTTTGNILTYWDRLKNWWNSWVPQPKTVTVTTQEQAVANAYSNAANSQPWAQNNPYLQIGQNNYTGTNSPQTGLSTVNEHGYETAKDTNIHMIGTGIARISSHANGGGGIVDHMTTVNEMQNDINNSVNNKLGATVAKLLSSTGNTLQELKKITQNTGQSADAGIKNIELNEKLANNLVNAFNSSSNSGSFSSLNTELEMANTAKDKASKMKIDDNTNYASLKNQVDSIKADIDDLDTTIDNTTDESTKKQLEAQKKVLKAKQDSVEKEMDLAKMVAENEIQNAKDSADQQVKIAEEKKDKLTKIAEAVTTAIENQLKAEDAAAEKTINNKLTKLESNYNKKLAALEEETTQTSRSDTEQDYNNKIAVLKTKMNNTASFADKQAYQLQINDLQKELSKQQDEWNTDDKKKALEDEYNKQKDTLEKQLKDTKEYYSKLEETDSLNAQARYILLNGSNQDLVDLLNSYNPQWQNAGQSLTDSLLTGLNYNKQTIQEAVGELVQIRSGAEYGADSNSGTYTYYDTATKTTKIGHYATGTNNNQKAGLYYTNEIAPEMSTKGDVAYVSQGAAIKNHMQTQAYIDSLVATEVSGLKASLIQSQQDTIRSMFGSIGVSKSAVTNNNDNAVNLYVEHFHNEGNQDIEKITNDIGFLLNKKRGY